MAVFNYNPSQGFRNLISPFTNLFKKPAALISPATPKTTPSISPTIQGLNYTPATGFAPNTSTPQGPRYFGPSVLPQVKKAPTAPAPTPKSATVAPFQAPAALVTPPAPVSTPPRPETPQTEPTPQPAPFAPTPAQQAALTSAESAYQKSLQISPEELSTQEDLDKLIESARKSYTNIRDQAIPLEFITGQLASVERRASDLAEPLERKLARMQAARLSTTEASKFALERADKAIESARGEAKDVRTEAESARRFGVEEAGRAATRAQADRTFEENKRQFGLDYAIKQHEAGLKAREVALKEKEFAATTGTPGTITPETGQALQLVNEIIPNVSAIAGPVRNPFSGTKDKLTQLTSLLAVSARKLIKGSGAVSDYEAKTLSDSQQALSGGYFSGRMSEGFVEQELKKIRGVLNANSGLPVKVKVTDPSSGRVKEGDLNRNDIFDAASQGFIIEYQ